MRIWDSLANAWKELKDEVRPSAKVAPVPHGEDPDDYEVRHQAVYNQTSGVETMEPVRVKKANLTGENK